MLKAVNYTLVPDVVIVAAGLSSFEGLAGDEPALELIVLGEETACLDAIVAHAGSLSKRLVGQELPAEDVFSTRTLAQGVQRFVLG